MEAAGARLHSAGPVRRLLPSAHPKPTPTGTRIATQDMTEEGPGSPVGRPTVRRPEEAFRSSTR